MQAPSRGVPDPMLGKMSSQEQPVEAQRVLHRLPSELMFVLYTAMHHAPP